MEVGQWRNKNSDAKRWIDLRTGNLPRLSTLTLDEQNNGFSNGWSVINLVTPSGTCQDQRLLIVNRDNSRKKIDAELLQFENNFSASHFHKSGSRQSNGSCIKLELRYLPIGPSTGSWNRKGWSKKTSYTPKGVEYPYFTEALCQNNIHQADLVGPRYIKGDGRFYSLNNIDLATHQVYIESQRTQEDRQVAHSLMRCWKSMGMPDFLSLDNALSFRGSNRHPRSFGLVIRLCLHFGVTPVFIPIREPWRNGVIESFNDSYDKNFFRRQWFSSYAMLKRQSKNFQRFHNRHHRYSCLKGKTPLESTRTFDGTPALVPPATKLPQLDYIPDGQIILIRFIRSNRILDVFTEKFKVPAQLVYSYVKAVIDTSIHTLQVYLGDQLIVSFDYSVPSK